MYHTKHSHRLNSPWLDLLFGDQANVSKGELLDTEESLGRPPIVRSIEVSGFLSSIQRILIELYLCAVSGLPFLRRKHKLLRAWSIRASD